MIVIVVWILSAFRVNSFLLLFLVFMAVVFLVIFRIFLQLFCINLTYNCCFFVLVVLFDDNFVAAAVWTTAHVSSLAVSYKRQW